jgi:hypothetical protein
MDNLAFLLFPISESDRRGILVNTLETQRVVKGDAQLCISAMPGIHGASIFQAALPP